MKTIRWGIIGCGDVTEVKSGPAIQKAEGSELQAVMRRNGDLAKDFARRHQVPKWYERADLLINDPEVDIVYIATPPSSHRDYTLDVARAGKPVYVEKPMARNYQETQEMVQACENAGVSIFGAYYRRGLPRFLHLKSLIDEGVIGDVTHVDMQYLHQPFQIDIKRKPNWRVDPEISGGGYFLDLGSHMLDLIQYFLGDIKEASGQTSNTGKLYNAEDCVDSEFIFENGVKGAGFWNFNAKEYLDKTVITGSKGKIVYPTFGNEPIYLIKNGETKSFQLINPLHIQQPLIQTIVNELNGKGFCPSTGLTAANTNWAMDKILNQD